MKKDQTDIAESQTPEISGEDSEATIPEIKKPNGLRDEISRAFASGDYIPDFYRHSGMTHIC